MASSRADGFGRTATAAAFRRRRTAASRRPVEPPRQPGAVVHVENPSSSPLLYVRIGRPARPAGGGSDRRAAGAELRGGADRAGQGAAAAEDRRVQPPRRRRVVGGDRAEPDEQRGDRAFARRGWRRPRSSARRRGPRSGRIATIDRLGAGLDRDRAAHRRHQLRAGPALAGDEQRMRDHRRDQPPRRAPRAPARGRAGRPCAPSPARGRAPWWRSSAPSSRRCPSRGSSAPHISSKAARTARCTGWSISTYSGPPPRWRFEHQEARVLARAVVVQLAGRLAGRAQPAALGRVVGHLRPAAQVGLAEPEVGEPARHPRRRASPRPGARRRRAPAARRRGPSPAPLSRSGSACSILQDERGRITASGSPQAARIAAARRRRPPRGRGGATRRRRRARPRPSAPRQSSPNPSARSSPSTACRWRKASRIRDFTVPSGRPSRRGDLAVAQPVVEGGDQHPRCSGAQRRRAPSRSRASRSAGAQRARSRRAPGRAGTAGRAGRAPGGRRGGRGRCAGCGRSRRSRSRRAARAGSKLAGAAPDRHHHVLGDLVGVGGAGARAHHERLDPPGIALEQRDEGRRGRAPATAEHQLGVAGGVGPGGGEADIGGDPVFASARAAGRQRHGSVKTAQGAGKSPARRARLASATKTKTSLTAATLRACGARPRDTSR